MAVKTDIDMHPASYVAMLDEEGKQLEFIPLVTITTREYRELCGKAALWDEYRADVERWCDGGEA